MRCTPTVIDQSEPRDATRGGVNVAALPRQRGRESPLSIEINAMYADGE